MESNVVNSPRALTSSSVPNPSSIKAKSVTLATESHSTVFVVFAFARRCWEAWEILKKNTSSSDFARRPFVFSMSLTDSFRWPLRIRICSWPQRGITIKRACIPCTLVRELLMKHWITRLVQVRTSRVISRIRLPLQELLPDFLRKAHYLKNVTSRVLGRSNNCRQQVIHDLRSTLINHKVRNDGTPKPIACLVVVSHNPVSG